MPTTKIALLGAGFIADIHVESYRRFVPEAEVIAVYARNSQKAEAFAAKHGIPQWFDDLEAVVARSGCDVVDVGLPNHLHHRAVMIAAANEKHVIVEKPLCLTLEQADEMIAAMTSVDRKLMYAEELCFAPKYERVKALAEAGAFGALYQVKQSEKHSGPHSDWFYNIEESGGGVLMDMGCHGLAWCRWFLGGRPRAESVTAHLQTGLLHGDRTRGEENSVVVVEFEGGALGVVENSWAKHGGMLDAIEVQGTGGVCSADLFQGNAATTYSEHGYDYAMEKAGVTKGWSFTVFEEAFNQGYPQELSHFIDCVRNDRTPKITGEDGRAVLELLYAAYASAGRGKRVQLPFAAKVSKPIDLWLDPSPEALGA